MLSFTDLYKYFPLALLEELKAYEIFVIIFKSYNDQVPYVFNDSVRIWFSQSFPTIISTNYLYITHLPRIIPFFNL